jgi:hypothetical protein
MKTRTHEALPSPGRLAYMMTLQLIAESGPPAIPIGWGRSVGPEPVALKPASKLC